MCIEYFAYFPCIINSKLLQVSHYKTGNESFLMVTKVSCISEAAEPLKPFRDTMFHFKMKFYQSLYPVVLMDCQYKLPFETILTFVTFGAAD